MQRLGDICRNDTEDDRTNGRRRKSCQGIKKISDYRHVGMAADSRNHLGGQLYHISRRPADQSAARAMAAPIFLGIQYSRPGHYCRHRRLISDRRVRRQRFGASNPRRMGQPIGTDPRRQIHLFQRQKSIRVPALRQQPLVQNARAGSIPATQYLDDCLCFRAYSRQTQRQPAAR